MAQKFLTNVELDAGLVDGSNSVGTSGQVLSSTGTVTSWIDPSTITAGTAEKVVIYAKNTHSASIAKGTPVYITGTVGATDTVQIAPADASNSAKMPAVGILDATLAVNAFGYVITGGFMDNITTSPIDGATPSSNDTVYVKAGGGLTLTKPTTAANLIQNIAKVGKVSGGNAGSLIVSSILRTNDVPNLTTGKIWVGDGNTVESSVVFLDEPNGRMGIGTTSPATPLDVAGNIQIGDGGTGASIKYNSTNRGTILVNGSEIMRLEAGGNVGIGTTSPSQKLEVSGNVQVSGYVRVGSGGNFAIGSVSGTTRIQGDGSNNTRFLSNGDVETMRLTSSGNLGIGTTNPGSRLTVSGTNNTTSEITLINTNPSTDNDWSITPFYNDQTLRFRTNSATTTVMTLKDDGNVGIGTTSPNANLHVYSSGNGEIEVERASGALINFQAQASLGTIGTDSNHPLYFKTNAGTRMAITTAGNIGIGTTSPLSKLHIDSTQDAVHFTRTGQETYRILHGTLGLYFTRPNSSALKFGITQNSDFDIYNDAASVMFRADSSTGNVGIGTTSPSTKLDVNGQVRIVSTNYEMLYLHQGDANGGFIKFTNTDDTDGWYTGIAGTEKFIISRTADNSTPIITAQQDGNVGIGETSPTQKLHVAGNARVTGAYYDSNNSSGTSGQVLSSTATGTDWVSLSEIAGVDGTGTANYVTKWSDTDTITNSLIYDNGSQVIINGTSSAFSDDLYLHNTSAYAVSGWRVGTTTTYVGKLVNNAGVLSLEADSARSIGFRNTTNGDIVRIDGVNSRVGIGTTSPTSKLHIKDDASTIYDATAYQKDFVIERKNTSGNNQSAHIRFLVTGYEGQTTGEASIGVIQTSNASSGHIVFTNRHNGTRSESLRIQSDGNVGIGAIHPTGKLEIQRSQVTTQFDRDCFLRLHPTATTDAGGFTNMFFGTSTTNNYGVAIGGKREGTGDGEPTFAIRMLDDSITGTEVLNINSSGKATFAGQVTVNSSNSAGVGLTVGGEAGGGIKSQYIFSGSGQRNWQIGMATHLTQTLSITPSTANGNTTFTTPILNLDGSDNSATFAGDVTLSSTAPTFYLDNTTSTTGKNWRLSSASNGKMYIAEHGVVDAITLEHTSGNATFGGSVTIPEYLKHTGDADTYFGFSASNQVLFHVGGSDRLIINSSGNVGIGTTSPSAKLEVSGTGNQGVQAWFGNGFVNNSAYHYDFARVGFSVEDEDGADTGAGFHFNTRNSGDNNWIHGYIYQPQDGGIVFGTGGAGTTQATEKMRIDDSGKVGIGATSPGEKLTVSGKTLTYGSTGGVGSGTSYFLGNSQNSRDIALTRVGSATLAIGYYSSGWQESVRFDSSGNVGIGDTSPSAKLSLYHATDDVSINVNTGTGGSYPKKTGISFGATSTSLGGDSEFKGGAGIQAINTASSNNPTDLAFWTTSGGSPAERMRIDSAGNVGIGTDNPTGLLHIKGDTNSNGAEIYLQVDNNSTTDDLGAIHFGNNVDATLSEISSGTSGANNSSYIRFATSSTGTQTERMRITSDGYVGIGDTPSYKLDVNVTSNRARFKATTGDANIELSSIAGHDWLIKSKSNSSFAIYDEDEASERLTIDSAGKVGIGETNPGYTLDVNGSVGVGEYIYHRGDNNTYLRFSGDMVQLAAGDVEMIRLVEDTQDAVVINEGGADVDFRVESDTETHALFLRGSDGYVGIGTDSPSGELHIKSASTNANLYIQRSTYDPWRLSAGSTYLGFMQDASEKMRIDSSGNVGIGTTSPQEELEVKSASFSTVAVNTDRNGAGENIGSFAFYGHNNASTPQNLLYSRIMGSMTDVTDGSEDGDIFFQQIENGSIAETFRVKSNGNVGIGTDNPTRPLHVNAGALNFVAEFQSTDDKASILIQDDDTLNYIHSQDGYLSLGGQSALSNNNLNIDSTNGNVGIGETNPNAKLQVSGVTGTSIIQALGADSNGFADLEVKSTGTTGASRLFFSDTAAQSGYIRYSHSSNSMEFATNAGERMRIASDGKVGIGTTSPSEKLTVSGDSNVTGKLAVGLSAAHPSIAFYNQNDAYFNGAVTVDDTITVTNLTYEATASSGNYHGEIVYFGSGTLTAGGLYVLGNSSGTLVWSPAQDSTAALATGLLAIALGTSVSSGLLVRGHAQNSNWGLGWTVGDKLYLSSTAGSISNSLTTDSNDFVRIIGYYLGSNKIYFCPDNTFVQNVA